MYKVKVDTQRDVLSTQSTNISIRKNALHLNLENASTIQCFISTQPTFS